MPSLRDIQADFSRALLGGGADAIAAAVLRDRLAPERRVQVYQNHVRITLREALAATFPVVARLVGEQYFAGAARRFVETLPPRTPVLAEYGAAFPAFLAAAPNAPAYLADVAHLEWALNAAYHAPDAPPLSPAHLTGLAPEAQAALRFQRHPASALVRSPFPILAIWRANQPDRDGSVDLAQGGGAVLVWREDGDAACRALRPGEAALVAALFDGSTLAEAASVALAGEPEFDLAAALAALLGAPIFAAASARVDPPADRPSVGRGAHPFESAAGSAVA